MNEEAALRSHMSSSQHQAVLSPQTAGKQFTSMGLILRGLAMGAADVIPGVSGGTIALVTGIYSKLIMSIKHCTDGGLGHLLKADFLGFWRHIDGNFLLLLFLGIFVSILGLSQVIHYLLEAYPQLLWGFFFGLILSSSIVLLQHLSHKGWGEGLAMLLGFFVALMIGVLNPASLPATPVVVFFAGSVAICAMILPGISGSFLLVLMGLYHSIIEAIRELNFAILFSFAAGCGIGLLLFSHVVAYLLSKFESLTLSALTGVMLGALIKVWPWQSQTDIGHFNWAPWILMPEQYVELTGQPSLILGVMVTGGIGVAMVLLFAYSEKKLNQ